jgi:hypothetical protein
MTVTLELRPEEVSALRSRAEADSVDIETVLHELDRFIVQVNYLPLTTAALRLAADLWAQAHQGGQRRFRLSKKADTL